MDKLLIYMSYDKGEYRNFFHLSVNEDVVIKCCSEEEVDDLFHLIIEKERETKSFELYVVCDQNALEWDYFKAFQKHGIETHPLSSIDPEKLCQIMNVLFDREYEISGKDDVSNKKLINIVYSGNCVLQKDNYKTGEILRQAETILNRGGEEMTELARIIKEKYDRMERYE